MSQYIQAPAKTREVFEYLRGCAWEMRTVTYKELAEAVGLAKPGIGRPLGYIRDEVCRRYERPWLNAIAVNTKTRRPGKSFLPENARLNSGDEKSLWRGMVLQVFAYDWGAVDFKSDSLS